MIAQDQLATLRGADVYDHDGDKIGSLGQVYIDTETDQPAWASVNTGLFGMNESLVPISDAEPSGDGIRVPYQKSEVKDAPHIDSSADEPLTAEEVAKLYEHYHLSGGGHDYAGRDDRGASRAAHEAGASAAGGTAESEFRGGGDAMTRSEERLNVGTQREQVGTARLRKYVVTENVQTTVPVQREEVRLEREPVTHENRSEAFSGPDLTESEHEVTLHAERPTIDTETVPVERVRLGKETVTEQETVGGDVRKEQIEADLPGQDGDRLR